jgi:pyruvate dehydrogenase E1 component beta subunit
MNFGVASEVIALAAEKGCGLLKNNPQRITFPDTPIPTSHALAKHYYPRAVDICDSVRTMFNLPGIPEKPSVIKGGIGFDVPDKTFKGPF